MYPSEEQEAAIEHMVRLLYQRALTNETLGPIFREAIHDWESHIKTVSDFLSGVIHGAGRYRGNVFAPHMKLRFEPEAFDDWLAVFESAASDELAPRDVKESIRVARHMANSFKAGLYPFTDAEGRPSRTPQA